MLSKTSLEQVYANRMTTMAQVDGMIRNFYNTRPHVLRAFQHDPNGPLYALHDHPVSSHLEVMRKYAVNRYYQRTYDRADRRDCQREQGAILRLEPA